MSTYLKYLLYICVMKTHIVYALINPIMNAPFYVGETSRFNERMCKHLNCKDKSKEKNAFIKNLIESGNKPKVIILDTVDSKELAIQIEKEYIKKYREEGHVLLNKNDGGNKPPSQKGAKFTEERKKEHSLNSPLKKRVQQLDKSGNIINEFHGVREACRITNIDHRSIAQVAAGSKIRKTAGGYKWKYI